MALVDLRGRATVGAADLGALTEQLKDIQFNAERQFTKPTASLAGAQEQLTRAGPVTEERLHNRSSAALGVRIGCWAGGI